jgi:hypothetical protein
MFKWFTEIAGSLWDMNVCLRRIEAATHTIEHNANNMNGRGAGMARKMEKLIESVNSIQRAVLKHCEAAKEDRLGLMLYDITADDLFMPGSWDRSIVCQSGVTCFNDICVTKLARTGSGGVLHIKRIMEWKRACVMRITESQVHNCLDEMERAAK